MTDIEMSVPVGGPASPARILACHAGLAGKVADLPATVCACGWTPSTEDPSHAQHQVDALIGHVGDLSLILSLHGLYQALYRVHGQAEHQWLMDAPPLVLAAYSKVQHALNRKGNRP